VDQNATVDDLPRPDANLLAEVLEASPYVVVMVDGNAVIRYVSPATEEHLGCAGEDLVGTVVFDRVHPDDLDRALLSMSWLAGGGAFAFGVTTFRTLHADGSWLELEVIGRAADVFGEPGAVIWGRLVPERQTVVEDVIHALVAGEAPEAVLRRVCDFVLWRDWGTQVGISWLVAGCLHWCSTGAPVELVHGAADGSPWDRARIVGAGIETAVADLDAHRQGLAAALSVNELRVEPLEWGGAEPALITVLTAGDGRTPAHHEFGVGQIRTMAELVLRWTAQSTELARTARTDALTGLANRRGFFERLDAEDGPGAIVFCDLDEFKPVNDALGHAAGDRVLRAVAERIAGAVRREDHVARLGGDEFAVICPGLDQRGAEALAGRLRREVVRAIDIDGNAVIVGMSVGVAYASDALDDDALNRADIALYAAKRGRRDRS